VHKDRKELREPVFRVHKDLKELVYKVPKELREPVFRVHKELVYKDLKELVYKVPKELREPVFRGYKALKALVSRVQQGTSKDLKELREPASKALLV